MLNKRIFIILIFFAIIIPLFSDGIVSNGKAGTEYIIRNINYTIDGRTRESVLDHYLDIKQGKIFVGKEALLAFLSDKQQLIDNERTLAGGEIKTSFTKDTSNPERVYVDLNVFVKDTWNYILLPYINYDSNEGFLLSLRGRDYSFFGSMETFSINLDYLKPDNNEPEYSINGGFKLPFYLWGLNWSFDFDEEITVSPDNPLMIDTEAGISMDIPCNNLTWQVSINQVYQLNKDGEDDPDGYFMKTSGRIGSSIPTGIRIPYLEELTYDVGIITSYAYKPFGTISPERKGYELGGSHGISAGQINWHGNFRDGLSFSADQNLRFNFTRDIWLSDTEAELQFHKSFGWGGISTRVMGNYLYNSTDEDIGGPIRGILNNRLDGNAAVFLNVDFPVKIWIWFLDRWFEGHISPFFDYALVKPDDGNFSLDEGWYGAGLEGFAFWKAARSIYLRVSFGVDLEAVLEGSLPGDLASRDGRPVYSAYFGLGHHY